MPKDMDYFDAMFLRKPDGSPLATPDEMAALRQEYEDEQFRRDQAFYREREGILSGVGRNRVTGGRGMTQLIGPTARSLPLAPLGSAAEATGEALEPVRTAFDKASEAWDSFAADHPRLADISIGAGLGAYGGPVGMLIGAAVSLGLGEFQRWSTSKMESGELSTEAGTALTAAMVVVAAVAVLRGRPRRAAKLYRQAAKSPQLKEWLMKVTGMSADDVLRAGASRAASKEAGAQLASQLAKKEAFTAAAAAAPATIAKEVARVNPQFTARVGQLVTATTSAWVAGGLIDPEEEQQSQMTLEDLIVGDYADYGGYEEGFDGPMDTGGGMDDGESPTPGSFEEQMIGKLEENSAMNKAFMENMQGVLTQTTDLVDQAVKGYDKLAETDDEAERVAISAALTPFMRAPDEGAVSQLRDWLTREAAHKMLIDEELRHRHELEGIDGGSLDKMLASSPELFGDVGSYLPHGVSIPDDDMVLQAAAVSGGLNLKPEGVASLAKELEQSESE